MEPVLCYDVSNTEEERRDMMIDLTRHHLFDGGMGTMLQAKGLEAGHAPELLNLTDPDIVVSIHAAYADAGADILTANTFGASRRKLGQDPRPCITAGVALARQAAEKQDRPVYVALDVGPLGALLEPMGELSFDDAYGLFAEVMDAGAAAGADLILIETMSDLKEAKAALLAAKERTSLPVFVTMTFGEDGRTFLGTDPAAAAVTLTSLGADVVGINCSLGPRELRPALQKMIAATHLPVMIQPNAGLPRLENGRTVFDVGPEEFAACGAEFLSDGAAILGGCCGTTPDHIRALRPLLEGHTPPVREPDSMCRLCGWQGVVSLGENTIATVGERINPTGRKKLQEALRSGNYDYAGELAIQQQEEEADFLVVNAGLPDIDEKIALPALVQAIQKVSPLPLVIDCSDPVALEKALRVCSGRPILNSVNGELESMEAMLPLAAKYGTGLIILALDGQGISDNPTRRAEAAIRVAEAAADLGIRDVFIDCLAMAASVNPASAMATPEAIRLVRSAGYRTILGVSNVSHGLPHRDAVNCAYLSACMAAGLNIAIVNTSSPQVMDAIDAARLLRGEDPGCAAYIARHGSAVPTSPAPAEAQADLEPLILSGKKGLVPEAVTALLQYMPPLEVINNHIIPALDTVGEQYEKGKLFLPQLLAAAEAVKAAFSILDRYLPQGAGEKGTVILATVKGDIHDIGKNIVKMLLENYSYHVVDLGRDVAPETVVEAALETGAPLVGLSSLMTTTAQNIAVTIQALRTAGATCKVMVGGAVVTEEFARQIGADYYVKDAAESARVAGLVLGR